MTPKFEDSPVVYFAYQRARTNAIQARVERKLGRRGETATRRELLTPAQRSAAIKAKQGPVGWVFEGASLEDVIADSHFLKKLVAIHRMRPYLRHSGRSLIKLRNGRTVRFNPRTGEVIRP